jgi:BirA family biotin operon repressor/biotin-[acetyl-CoA-carboxylase] ligase
MPPPRLIFDDLSPPGEELRLVAQSVFNLFPSWDVRAFGEVDSTNAEARRLTLLMGGDAWPRVLLTDFQSAGRGRHGRAWQAPAGTSLLVTVMIPLALVRYTRTLMPLAYACWLTEGLESLGVPDVAVKWPNDVLVRGQKVAGILCETAGEALVAGLGVNLTQSRLELPERAAHEPQATSLALELGPEFPGRLAASLSLLNAVLASIEHPPGPDWILQAYRRRCVTFGTSVACRNSRQQTVAGIARDIDPTGALLVEVEGCKTVAVTEVIEPV